VLVKSTAENNTATAFLKRIKVLRCGHFAPDFLKVQEMKQQQLALKKRT
jgi:hypothetical protein